MQKVLEEMLHMLRVSISKTRLEAQFFGQFAER